MLSTDSLISLANRPWMGGAEYYCQAKRDTVSGSEIIAMGTGGWFQDYEAINFLRPFFRTLDGGDHTYFCIDIDLSFRPGDEKRFSPRKRAWDRQKLLERRREILLTAGVNWWRRWVIQNREHKFFWKVSGGGLHALQFVPERIDRCRLERVVTEVLFPRCPRAGTTTKTGRRHRCTSRCSGWHLQTGKTKKDKSLNWTRYVKMRVGEEMITIKMMIDLSMFTTGQRMLRWTFSPWFKIPGVIFYSVPIISWDPKQVLTASRPSGLEVHPYRIPPFQFWDEITSEADAKAGGGVSSHPADRTRGGWRWTRKLEIYDPEQADDLPEHIIDAMDKIDNWLTRPDTPLCIQTHYHRVKQRIGQHHWSRVLLCRYLGAWVGEPWSFWRLDDIANWVRFRVNNERDNLPENRSKLFRNFGGIAIVGGDVSKNRCPNCLTIQSSQYFFACDVDTRSRCWRGRNPLQERDGTVPPSPQTPPQTVTPHMREERTSTMEIHPPTTGQEEGFESIKQQVLDLFNSQQHAVIHKSTRAGFTTTAIVTAAMTKKKILVAVPTNRIAKDTFTTALNIAFQVTGKALKGVVLVSNLKGCLRLALDHATLTAQKMMSPTWGEEGVAFEKLPYHTKPPCTGQTVECRFSHTKCVFQIPEYLWGGATEDEAVTKIRPLIECKVDEDMESGLCSHLTFMMEMDEFEVVVVTYRKLYTLMVSDNPDNKKVLSSFIKSFDVLILDEISHLVESEDTHIPITKVNNPIQHVEQLPEYYFFTRLREDLQKLTDYEVEVTGHVSRDSIFQYIREVVEQFIEEFDITIRSSLMDISWAGAEHIWLVQDHPPLGKFTDLKRVGRPPLPRDQRIQLRRKHYIIHNIIQNIAKEQNVYLGALVQALSLLGEDKFIIINTTTLFNRVNLSFVIGPKVKEIKRFVHRFIKASGKQVIITDATMPEVNLSEYFQIPLVDVTIGDPRGTNQHQLVIADSRRVRLQDLWKGRRCNSSCRFYVNDRCQLEEMLAPEMAATLRGKKGYDWRTIRERTRGLQSPRANSHCHLLRQNLLQDIRSVCNTHGGGNVIIVAPNKEVAAQLLDLQANQLIHPSAKITYYRSDLTVGVSCDRRVMFCILAPIPPKNSHLWLAYYYQREGLMTHDPETRVEIPLSILSEILRENTARQAFWQTIGRAKAPDCSERSVVYCWGISGVSPKHLAAINSLASLLRFQQEFMGDCRPELLVSHNRGSFTPLLTARGGGIERYAIYQHWDKYHHQAALVWRRLGVIVNNKYLRLVRAVNNLVGVGEWLPHSKIRTIMGIKSEKVLDIPDWYPQDIHTAFGLSFRETSKALRGHQTIRLEASLNRT